jgi:flagellar hook-associated protein 2
LQTPANFSKQTAKISNASVATAEITATAASGSYLMKVTALAQPAIWNVSGFEDEATALEWYSDKFGAAANKPLPTVFRTGNADDKFVLSLTASDNDILLGDQLPPTTKETAAQVDGTTYKYFKSQDSTDAEFTLNGVSFTRASNKVTDALTGVTLNLTTTATDPITLTVFNEQVSARSKLDALVKAYNDLYALYKEQTASSIDVATRGILNSDFAVSSVMRQLVSSLTLPMTNMTGGALDGQTDLSAMGLKFLDSGKLAIDDTLYASASGTLQTRLSAGIRIGYNSSTLSDLSSQIGDMVLSGGVIQDRIASEQSTQSDLNKRKTALQEKLVSVQARYTAQYASLDALLFKLQGTSDSLKSALDGLTNSQKNN